MIDEIALFVYGLHAKKEANIRIVANSDAQLLSALKYGEKYRRFTESTEVISALIKYILLCTHETSIEYNIQR